MLSRMGRIFYYLNNSLLTVQLHMVIMDVQEVLLNMLLIMLSTFRLRQKVNIHIKHKIKNAQLLNLMMILKQLILRRFKDLIQSNWLKLFFLVRYQLEQMQADQHSNFIARALLKNFVVQLLIMLFSQLDMGQRTMQIIGLLKILGQQNGESKAISEFLEI